MRLKRNEIDQVKLEIRQSNLGKEKDTFSLMSTKLKTYARVRIRGRLRYFCVERLFYPEGHPCHKMDFEFLKIYTRGKYVFVEEEENEK